MSKKFNLDCIVAQIKKTEQVFRVRSRSSTVCVCTLVGQLSSLGEQSCDVEGRRTSSQDLMEHGLQRSLSYCSRENYRDREYREWSEKARTKGEDRKLSKRKQNLTVLKSFRVIEVIEDRRCLQENPLFTKCFWCPSFQSLAKVWKVFKFISFEFI